MVLKKIEKGRRERKMMLLLLTSEKEQKKEYKEMLEGLCEEMPDQV